MMNEILGIAGVFLPIGIVILIVILILATGYVKAGIKIPFLEKKDELNLQLIPIDVKTSSAVPTADYINICVDAAVNVKISDNPERIKRGAGG